MAMFAKQCMDRSCINSRRKVTSGTDVTLKKSDILNTNLLSNTNKSSHLCNERF